MCQNLAGMVINHRKVWPVAWGDILILAHFHSISFRYTTMNAWNKRKVQSFLLKYAYSLLFAPFPSNMWGIDSTGINKMAVEDEYVKLTKELLNRIAKTVLYIQSGDCVSAVTVPWFKQIAQIASDTILLLEKGSFYNACLIAASMMESILQLTFLDTDINEKCKTYGAFGLIEDLERIQAHPEEYEETKDALRLINSERFLKKNPADKNPLNRHNYIEHWYNFYGITNFSNMVKKIKQPYIDHIYKSYSFLCGFKHFQPYHIVRLYDIHEKKLFENPGQKWIAAEVILYSLIEAVIIINKYQENKIDILDISQKATTLMLNNP